MLPETLLAAGQGRAIGAIFDHMIVNRSNMPDEVVCQYRQQACEPGALTAMLNYYRAAVRGGSAIHQQKLGYPNIKIPTLVIWGLQDHALAQENLDGLDEFVTDLTVVKLDHAGHFVHQDEPQRVTREIISWLQRRSLNS